MRWLGDVLTGIGVVAEGLARTPPVRSASTTGAKVAAGALAVHAVSRGSVAASIVAADAEGVESVLTDLEQIARTVHVVVQTDGSVLVEGIPATVPEQLREVVARIAADAAIRHVERTLRVRPAPSRDDRRLFTKAAREALVAEARRRRHRPEAPAA